MTEYFSLEGTFANPLAQLLFKCGEIQSHKAPCSFVMNISKDGEFLTSLDSLFQCFNMFIMHIFFLLIFHQNSFCCSMCPLCLILSVNLWEGSVSIFRISHLMAVESKQVPSELYPGWASPVQPLLIYQLLSCPWPHCWFFTGLPACLSYSLGSPNQTHNSRCCPQVD